MNLTFPLPLPLSSQEQNRIVLAGKLARIKILKQSGITKENLNHDLICEILMFIF